MYDLRYHIATIVGMLLMLGIGIMIGSASGFGQTLIKHQTTTIQGLSDKLDSVLKDSAHDHNLLKQHQTALAAIIPRLVAGKLAGKQIAIVRIGDYDDSVTDATNAVTAAGASIASVTTLTDRIDSLDTTQRSKVLQDLGLPPPANGIDPDQSILHPLVAIFRVGLTKRPNLQSSFDTLADDGIINQSGSYDLPVQGVLIVGGTTTDDDSPAARALIDSLADKSVSPSLSVVGCEPEDAAFSSISDFAPAGIATVDCIDQPIGALDLPFALAGEVADYGVKPTASRLIPQSLEGVPVISQPAPTRSR